MGDHVCPWWFAYTFDNRFRTFFHNPEKMLGPYVSTGMTVLDVGCGMGFFSIGLARLVGDSGSVISADVQAKMLSTLHKRSKKVGVAHIIRLHQCEPGKLGVDTPVDFVLAFWMVHEVPEFETFFQQIRSCLKPNGRMLIAEPRFHVSPKRFQQILLSVQASGFELYDAPAIKFSHSAVFKNNTSKG